MNEVELGKPDPGNPERGPITALFSMLAHEGGGVTFDTNAKNYYAIRDAIVTLFQQEQQVLDVFCDALIVYQFEFDRKANQEAMLAKHN
jgi:hypothetical protein